MRILHVVGARPNFVKCAPVMRALSTHRGIHQALVHTGQHYDANMSQVFFDQLRLPGPDIRLDTGGEGAPQSELTRALAPIVSMRRPDWVVVYGDVDSTVAAARVAAEQGVRIAHVEAGLRSFDRTMPEELNRIATDRLASLHFTPSRDAGEHLRREGIRASGVKWVGNVMIDTLRCLQDRVTTPPLPCLATEYALLTMHRPSNVDSYESAKRLLELLDILLERLQVVFPIHPRTRRRLETFGLSLPRHERFCSLEPQGYLQFLALEKHAAVVLTDSGGVQEETTALGVPCLTLRENTERPVTVAQGTNRLVGQDRALLRESLATILAGHWKRGVVPELWDGNAAKRIAGCFFDLLKGKGATVPEPLRQRG